MFLAIGMYRADISRNGFDEQEVLFGVDLQFRLGQFAAIPANIEWMPKQVIVINEVVQS